MPLSLNATVPVGTPAPGATTPAVNVTEAPEYDGLALAASVTLVFCWIASVSGADVLVRSMASPP